MLEKENQSTRHTSIIGIPATSNERRVTVADLVETGSTNGHCSPKHPGFYFRRGSVASAKQAVSLRIFSSSQSVIQGIRLPESPLPFTHSKN